MSTLEKFEVGNKTRVLVWFGDMEFGTFDVHQGENPDPVVLVHDILEKVYLYEDEIEQYADQNNYIDFMIPSVFEGEVLFSKTFLRRMLSL